MERDCEATHKYQSELPYPKIQVIGPNPYYANIIKEDYAGMVSEMTAINQYLYHYFDTKNYDKEVGDTLEQIAIVEMRHLEILAELISLLGEKPIYYTQNSFWSACYVYYGNNLYEQLVNDLNSEYAAIENYNCHINIINDPYIKEILERIIADEEEHIKILKDLINKMIKV